MIDGRDILHPESDLKKRLDMPSAIYPADMVTFLYDLTERHPTSNIAVDEVPQQKVFLLKVHHKDFQGSLWMAVLPVMSYDF